MEILEHEGVLHLARNEQWEQSKIFEHRVAFISDNIQNPNLSYDELVKWSHVWASMTFHKCVFDTQIEKQFRQYNFNIPKVT